VPAFRGTRQKGLDPAGDQRNRDISCTGAAHVPILTITDSGTLATARLVVIAGIVT
jgi:hypothetical protein